MCRWLGRWFLYICAFDLALIILPGLPPFGVEFVEKDYIKLPLEGVFEINSKLNDAEILNKEILNSDIGWIRVTTVF